RHHIKKQHRALPPHRHGGTRTSLSPDPGTAWLRRELVYKYAGEGAAHREIYDEPEHGRDERGLNGRGRHEDMEAENIDDHRTEKQQRQRNIPVREQERAPDDLRQKDDYVEMRSKNDPDEFFRGGRRRRRGRNKVQKAIQAES